VSSLSDLERALDGVLLEAAPVALESGWRWRELAALFLDLVARRGLDGATLRGSLGADPLAAGARCAASRAQLERALQDLPALVTEARTVSTALRTIRVDTTLYHGAGASDALDLACATATGVAYLRALDAGGLDLASSFGALSFSFALDTEFFRGIAKLRAARLLWARVAEECGAAAAGAQHQEARTGERVLSRVDPLVNLLRATATTFAAVLGGAEAIVAAPYDLAGGAVPSALARRLARNTQLLLAEEAYLHEVLDPAGGSYFLEAATDALAEEAWARFQRIEAAGGMVTALTEGSLAGLVAEEADARAVAIARRRPPLVGVSDFAGDFALEVLEVGSEPAAHLDTEPPVAEAFPLRRLAEPFEELRAAASSVRRHGVSPRVFLATLGPQREWTPRAHFAQGLLAAGGIEALGGRDGGDPASVAADFQDSGLALAVLCSSEERYRAQGKAAVVGLREAGAQRVYWAGPPGADREALLAAGVGAFLFHGADVLALLRDIHWHLNLGARGVGVVAPEEART
jgi:methylmalonyl-CoA mutase